MEFFKSFLIAIIVLFILIGLTYFGVMGLSFVESIFGMTGVMWTLFIFLVISGTFIVHGHRSKS